MVKTKLGLAGLLFLAGCTTIKPGGSIEMAYVPVRIDDKWIENELFVGLEGYVESSLNNTTLTVGGKADTYMQFPKDENIIGGFSPTRISYDFYTKLKRNNLELYAFHNCTHPIEGETTFIQDEEGIYYALGYDAITKIGVKLEF